MLNLFGTSIQNNHGNKKVFLYIIYLYFSYEYKLASPLEYCKVIPSSLASYLKKWMSIITAYIFHT